MSYGFNNNTYEVLRSTAYRDVFNRKSINLSAGDQVGSAIVNAIIVDKEDQEATYDLEGQNYIDLMVSLSYVKLSGVVPPPIDYILDTVTALKGYSLRKLKETATKAIRVRRSSDNEELDIGFIGEDLDEISLLNFIGLNDGYVITIYNQVNDGISENLIQATAIDQPIIVSSGVIIKRNNKPSIDFVNGDGRDFDLSNPAYDLGGNFMLSTIIETLTPTTTQVYFRAGGLIRGRIFLSQWVMSSGSSFFSSTTPKLKLSNISYYYNGENSEIDDDGNVIIGNSGNGTLFNAINIGQTLNGYMSEIIFLSNNLEKETLKLNQDNYYSIV